MPSTEAWSRPDDDGGSDAAGQPRQQQGHADLGAYSSAPGNLTYDFAVDFPACIASAQPCGQREDWRLRSVAILPGPNRFGCGRKEDELWLPKTRWVNRPGLEARMTGSEADCWHVFPD